MYKGFLRRAIVYRLLWSLKSHGIDESVFCLPLYKNVFASQTLRSLKFPSELKSGLSFSTLVESSENSVLFRPRKFSNFNPEFFALFKAPRDYEGFEESLGAMLDDWDMERWLFIRNHGINVLSLYSPLQVFSLQSLKFVYWSRQ